MSPEKGLLSTFFGAPAGLLADGEEAVLLPPGDGLPSAGRGTVTPTRSSGLWMMKVPGVVHTGTNSFADVVVSYGDVPRTLPLEGLATDDALIDREGFGADAVADAGVGAAVPPDGPYWR